ncbi:MULTISPECIES: NAD(P)-dependent oxidoreductase [unclassified Haladaptatus]|uniref:NAD-dependent epimerase/dehydratase family protein n=1 Tax=unclassified Haladaptatus TaxID=2622732 RepID=UPI00209C1DB7|nr:MULTISPECIES: NAD(P)-dependent oxidoreductase [unclassified Haladaptatus]MCO8244781.1 NAD(P)-dependent oxidoreductase [Haladaptatus sp. AB643]MCO8255707.1 NAD(P)-dependent oxidoreductase [Haladaptatus sp. AB618]
MHVLVTGGCGYIGSVLVPMLQADTSVTTVSILDDLSTGSPRSLLGTYVDNGTNIVFRRGDVRKYGDVENAMRGVDAVIHLAGITGAASTHDRRDETYAVNLDGTTNVLTAAEKFGVGNVVFASSCNNYGRATNTEITEETESNPLNPYAETKHKGEQLLIDHVENGHFRGTALRMSTNYGYAPGIRFNLVINRFVFRAVTDRPLTVYGDGTNWRPFIHVNDAARAFKQAACNPDDWSEVVYNVGANEENYRISEIAEIISNEIDGAFDITYLEDEHPGPSYHVNFDRVSRTGFEPEWTVRDGVRDLMRQFTDTHVSTIPK